MKTSFDHLVLLAAVLGASVSCSPRPAPMANPFADRLVFGDPASERAHGFQDKGSEAGRGGLNEPMRTLLPPKAPGWEGGRISFDLAVFPDRPNYLTARFWGDDVNPNRLILFCEGKQVGYRHLGDIEILDFGSAAPGFNGRFFYRTTPLPENLTRGKTKIRCEIVANGPIWGYGQTFEKYQKPMNGSSRGIYAVYTHGEGCFSPPADEVQGKSPTDVPARSAPGAEVLTQLQIRVNGELAKLLRQNEALNQMQMQFLARAYFVNWTPASRNPAVVEKVVAAADSLYLQYLSNPKLAQFDPVTPNPDWFGFGPAGHAISLLAPEILSSLDAEISDGRGGVIARRKAWSDMLFASRDWNERNRRLYTNQSMIKDLNIFLANRGLAAVDPARARPEAEVLDYLKQSIGLVPWLGSMTDQGPERPLGDNYFQLTRQGLTKELGYVGNYGEVIDWVSQIYNATRPAPGKDGDPDIKNQLVKIARARAIFRYPMLDADGARAMRLETIIGWRDDKYPGDVTYAQRPSWDGSSVEAAAATLDPNLVGYCQQLFGDNQFFASVAHQMEQSGFRSTCGLLSIPEDYKMLAAQPVSSIRLPMEDGQPDFAWADEENGVIAVKHGDELLYVSLYWRARNAVNFLAKVHYITARFDRIAVVRQSSEYDPFGQDYVRGDWVDAGFANGRFKYAGSPGSAHAGEKLPIAKIPEGIAFKPGDESVYAGRATFYSLHYGPYLIAMNTTKDRSFDVEIPEDLRGKTVVNLMSKQAVELAEKLTVGPASTVILHAR